MSAMMETAPQDSGSVATIAEAPSHRIKRTGARPLTFEGTELGMAMSYAPALPYWYEINVYRTLESSFVVAVRLFHQSEDIQDTVRAWECADLESALDALSRYDAAMDVPMNMDLDGTDMAASELAAHALELRARIASARQHYKSLVGEFFFDLEAGA